MRLRSDRDSDAAPGSTANIATEQRSSRSAQHCAHLEATSHPEQGTRSVPAGQKEQPLPVNRRVRPLHLMNPSRLDRSGTAGTARTTGPTRCRRALSQSAPATHGCASATESQTRQVFPTLNRYSHHNPAQPCLERPPGPASRPDFVLSASASQSAQPVQTNLLE